MHQSLGKCVYGEPHPFLVYSLAWDLLGTGFWYLEAKASKVYGKVTCTRIILSTSSFTYVKHPLQDLLGTSMEHPTMVLKHLSSSLYKHALSFPESFLCNTASLFFCYCCFFVWPFIINRVTTCLQQWFCRFLTSWVLVLSLDAPTLAVQLTSHIHSILF